MRNDEQHESISDCKGLRQKKTDSPVALVCAIFAAATASSTVKMFSQGKTLAGVMGILLFAALATPSVRGPDGSILNERRTSYEYCQL